jgi:hypothetical protein
MAPHPAVGAATGVIQADVLPAGTTCKPGAICAYKQTQLKGCYFNNVWKKNSYGATPLAIDVTETPGTTTYVYWVNNLNTNLEILGKPTANYYCPSTTT